MERSDRFWRHVSRAPECWEWTGARRNGYGVFAWTPTDLRIASRAAWELTYGSIPGGQQVLHTCDNPPCVRPDHLRLGTQSDNRRDAIAAGHMPPRLNLDRDPLTGRWLAWHGKDEPA